MIIYIVSLLIYAIIITAVAVRDMILRKSFYKYLLTGLILLIFALIVIIFFYNEIKEHESYKTFIDYFSLCIFILLSVLLFFVTRSSLVKQELDSVMFDSISKDSYALFLNKDNKILEISDKFLKELGLADPSLITSKNATDVLYDYLKIESINNFQFKQKKDLDFIFNNRSNDSDISFEIKYYNALGVYSSLVLYQKEIHSKNKYVGSIFYSKETNLSDKTNVLKEEMSLAKSDYFDLKNKFNSLLDVISEGVYFLDKDDMSIWFNDHLVDVLELRYNTISISDFYSKIHKDDYKHYLTVINSLSKDNPTFSFKYRFLIDDFEYVYIKESAKALFKGDELYFITGSISVLSPIGFKKEDNDYLDNLKGENDLLVHLASLTKEAKRYQLVYLRVKNIPEINEEHGRQIGSLVLGDYVKTLSNYFSHTDDFYRISGLDFVFLIRQDSKIQKFRKVLEQKNILTPDLIYGNANLKMDAYIGIAFSKDGKSGLSVYNMAKETLEHCIKSGDKRHYMYYSDLEVLR